MSNGTLFFPFNLSLVKKSLALCMSEVRSAWSYSHREPQEQCSV